MFGLLIRIIVFEACVVFFATVMMLFTSWRYEEAIIDNAYEREVVVMRWVSLGEADDERLPIERRAVWASDYVIRYIDSLRVPEGVGRYTVGLVRGAEHIDAGVWWRTVARPRMARFLPTLYMRVETFSLLYAITFPLLLLCYFLGEHYARKRTMAARGKKNQVVTWLRWSLSLTNTVLTACAGLVIFPPVALWIVPCLLLCGLIAVLIRANFVELR